MDNNKECQEPTLDDNKEAIPQWKLDIAKKLHDTREEARKKKYEELGAVYNEKLGTLIDMYFNAYSNDEEENTLLFNVLNKEWMSIVQKVNATQKVIRLQTNAFSLNVKDMLENEEFKAKLEAHINKVEVNETNEATGVTDDAN